MLDHISIPVVDVDRAAVFYDAVLATIGLRRRKERPGAIGYGPDTRAAPVFWILDRRPARTWIPFTKPRYASVGAMRGNRA